MLRVRKNTKDMKSLFKKIKKNAIRQITTTLILVAFLSVVFLSFAAMIHVSDSGTIDDCLFPSMGQSLCPQNTVATIIHHIYAYHSFLNISVGTNVMILVVSLLFAASIALIIFIRPPKISRTIFSRVLYDSHLVVLYRRKITRWLSLFENSPSHI